MTKISKDQIKNTIQTKPSLSSYEEKITTNESKINVSLDNLELPLLNLNMIKKDKKKRVN